MASQLEQGPTYWAFISYSHRDRSWGRWLHRGLETYRVPKRLIGRATRTGVVPKRLFPVFRDREELPTDSNLGDAITSALRASRSLVVICSPHAATSRWVNEEVLSFKRMGRACEIRCLIVDGEPNAAEKPDTAAAECFPHALRFDVDGTGRLTDTRVEPIAADARPQGDGKRDAKLKILAGVLGVGFDELRQRDHERRTRRLMRLGALFGLIALAMAALAILAMRESARAHDRLLALYTEQGRQELLADHPLEGALYLSQACIDGRHDATLLSMLHQACHPLTAREGMLAGHRGPLTCVTFDPGGRLLATGSEDHTIRVWDGTRGDLVAVLKGAGGPIRRARFDRTGERVLGVDQAGQTWLWSARGGEPIRVFPGQSVVDAAFAPGASAFVAVTSSGALHHQRSDDVRSTSLTPGGGTARLAASGERVAWIHDAEILVQEVGRSDVLRLRAGGAGFIDAVPASAAPRVAALRSDGSIVVWRLDAPGEPLQLPGGVHPRPEDTWAVFDERGEQLCVIDDQVCIVWDLRDGSRAPLRLRGHRERIASAAFDGPGQLLLTASDDRSARLWNIATGRQIAAFWGHSAGVVGAVLKPGGGLLVTASYDGTAVMWHPGRGRLVRPVGEVVGSVSVIAQRRDSDRLAAGTHDGVVYVVSPADPGAMRRVGEAVGAVRQIGLDVKGRRVTTVHEDGAARIWNAEAGGLLATLSARASPDVPVLLSPDARHAAGAAPDRQNVLLWDLENPSAAHALRGHQHPVTAISFSPDGSTLVSGDDSGLVLAWSVSGRSLLFPMRGHSKAVRCLGFDAGGSRIYSADDDGLAVLWSLDAQQPRSLQRFRGHRGPVHDALFDDRRDMLITGGADGTVRFWAAASEEPVATIAAHSTGVLSVSLDARGRLCTAASDGAARLWSLPSQALLAQAPAGSFSGRATFSGGSDEVVGLDPTLHLSAWTVGAEDRKPSDVARFVRQHVPYVLEGGVIQPLMPDPLDRPRPPGLVGRLLVEGLGEGEWTAEDVRDWRVRGRIGTPIELPAGEYGLSMNGTRARITVGVDAAARVSAGAVRVTAPSVEVARRLFMTDLLSLCDRQGEILHVLEPDTPLPVFPGRYRLFVNGSLTDCDVSPGTEARRDLGRILVLGPKDGTYAMADAMGLAMGSRDFQQAVALLPGTYRIRVGTRPAQEVVIRPGELTRVTVD